mmetsp:Transcript_33902/g.44718  ORF Transcript_33902/g.44718 Transcript_33902/m.44718 type:complete len:164 (-) Transcript_33902:102-593(-)
MSTDTMWRLGFDITVQIIRIIVAALLLFFVEQVDPVTPASRLDQEWLKEFFKLMILFFIFINFMLVLGAAADSPQVIYIILRFFGGTCATLSYHIRKGFTLYDDLTPIELSDGRDSEILYFMRIFFLYICCGFTLYLLFSCCCMCCITGIDGDSIGDVRRAHN